MLLGRPLPPLPCFLKGPPPVPKHMGSESKHAFTEEERANNGKMDKLKAEYSAFVRTKLHLDK
jgi:hypothetical protein